MGNMTVEEIYRDRKTFSSKVFEVATSDLVNMGMQVVSYTLKDITDDVGYLKALGEARTAEVQRDARWVKKFEIWHPPTSKHSTLALPRVQNF